MYCKTLSRTLISKNLLGFATCPSTVNRSNPDNTVLSVAFFEDGLKYVFWEIGN